MNVPLFKWYIDFNDKRRVRREMVAETEKEVIDYIANKYNTWLFQVTKGEEVGVKIK